MGYKVAVDTQTPAATGRTPTTRPDSHQRVTVAVFRDDFSFLKGFENAVQRDLLHIQAVLEFIDRCGAVC